MLNASSEHRRRRILKHAATLLAAALLAYAVFLVAQSWRQAKSGQTSQAATIAALGGNALDIYFEQLEIGMRNLGADLAGTTRQQPDLERAFVLFRRFQALHTELGSVMLLRGDGQILLTGTTPNQPDLPTLAGDPAFAKIVGELQGGRSFVISRPVLGNIDKSWVVSARHAVTDQSGKLAYIISANLPTDMLQRYRVDASAPEIGALGLLRDDGYLVSRYPQPEGASLDQLYGQPVAGAMLEFLRANGYPQQGQVEMRDSDGTLSGLLVLRRLQHYPLTLFVEIPIAGIRAAWWHDMHAPYLLMALVLAGTLAFFGLSLQRRRIWSQAQRCEEMRRNYEEALQDRSPNEILMFDTATLQATYANDAALENLGYTLQQLSGKNLLDLQPQLGIEALGALMEPLRRGEQESVKYQTMQTRANGSSYPVEVGLQLLTAEDGDEKFLAIVNDISALKQAEENIRKLNVPVERRAARGK